MLILNVTPKEIINKQLEDIQTNIPILYDKLEAQPLLKGKDPEQLIREMLKFLFLVGKHKIKLTPALLVDYTWHEFILFTRFYMRFCSENYDRYLHHSPGGGEEENHKQFIQTIKLYFLEFGEAPSCIWGDYYHNDSSGLECGSCFSS